MKPTALQRYSRDAHFEVLDGIAVVRIGKRNSLAIVVFHFLSERDARTFAREHPTREAFRVDRQRRTKLEVRR